MRRCCRRAIALLVGVHKEDTPAQAAKLADKVAGLRIFNDAEGKMNLSLADLPESDVPNVLAISNFTVYGDAAKSRRPNFTSSAGFEAAWPLFETFLNELKSSGLRVETGEFGADMQVSLTNDGPVTVLLEV